LLSHPLLVEAIENEFHPVVVHNNKKGRDAEILKRFKEPAWNNPVVRILDAKGKDLIARKGGIYDVPSMATRMVLALEAAKKPVPAYLQLLALSDPARVVRKASFAMY